MLNFGESVIVALISAAVALIVSIVFRWFDRERPVWRISSVGYAAGGSETSPPYIHVEVTNIGNGPAYDAVLMNVHTPWKFESAKPVLLPGETLHGLVDIPTRYRVERDGYGGAGRFYLSGHQARGVKFYVQYRKPPIYLISWRKTVRLSPILNRERDLRNEMRSIRKRAEQRQQELRQ